MRRSCAHSASLDASSGVGAGVRSEAVRLSPIPAATTSADEAGLASRTPCCLVCRRHSQPSSRDRPAHGLLRPRRLSPVHASCRRPAPSSRPSPDLRALSSASFCPPSGWTLAAAAASACPSARRADRRPGVRLAPRPALPSWRRLSSAEVSALRRRRRRTTCGRRLVLSSLSSALARPRCATPHHAHLLHAALFRAGARQCERPCTLQCAQFGSMPRPELRRRCQRPSSSLANCVPRRALRSASPPTAVPAARLWWRGLSC